MVFVVAGCGNSAPTNSSFASKADAICASLDAASAKAAASGGVAAVKSEQALRAAALSKLEVLSAPYNLAGPYQAFLYEFAQVEPVLGRLAAATAAHKETQVTSLEAQVHGFERNAKGSATDAGLKGCA
jgi:hypothetical protein